MDPELIPILEVKLHLARDEKKIDFHHNPVLQITTKGPEVESHDGNSDRQPKIVGVHATTELNQINTLLSVGIEPHLLSYRHNFERPVETFVGAGIAITGRLIFAQTGLLGNPYVVTLFRFGDDDDGT